MVPSSAQAKVEVLFIYATARRRLRLALRRAVARTAGGLGLAVFALSLDLGQVRDPVLLFAAMLMAYTWITGISAVRLHTRFMVNARSLLPQELYLRIRSLDDFDALGFIIKIGTQGPGHDGTTAEGRDQE
jgi:hypothetical protein